MWVSVGRRGGGTHPFGFEQQIEERRLARAIRAHDANTALTVKSEVDTLE